MLYLKCGDSMKKVLKIIGGVFILVYADSSSISKLHKITHKKRTLA